MASEICLSLFVLVDMAAFYVFKIESCFPSRLESKQFHSPFVEKGMKIYMTKLQNTSTPSAPKSNYSRVANVQSP